jgi:serine/threonine protein kinase
MAKTQPFDSVDDPPPEDPLIRQMLGDFRVERFIAQGGMGMVYEAVHPILKKRAAVKVLRPELQRDPEQEERFLKEAQAISSISHRGIIQVFNFGKLPPPDRRQFMVMEFLEGKTLEALLHEEGPLAPNRALPIVDEICDALSAAHRVDVVHRDLKPSNVFLARQSNGASYAKLVDFGLAKAMGGKQSAKASVIAGTPEYISPEQAKGTDVTAQTDLYCLGVMIFEMISGGLPFAGSNLVEFLRAHIEQPAPRLSSYVPVPESLDDLVASLLEKDPTLRPHSAEAVQRTIAQILRETRDASTMQVAAPKREPVAAPRATDEDPFAFEDTRRSGSSPAEAAAIAQVRERASGPTAAPAPRPSRPSGSKRLSKPDIVAPVPKPRQSSPRLQAPPDESQRTLLAVEDDRTAPQPFKIVLPNGQTPAPELTPGARSTASKMPLVVAGAVLIGVLLAGVAWKVTRPPQARSEIIEIAAAPKPPVLEPEPLPPTPPAGVEQTAEYKAGMEAAVERERRMSQENGAKDFSTKMKKIGREGIRTEQIGERAQEIKTALGQEGVEQREVELKRAEGMFKDQKAQDEMRQMQAEEELKKVCGTDWKRTGDAGKKNAAAWKRATKDRVNARLKDKKAAYLKLATEEGTPVEGRMAQAQEDANDLKRLIDDAATLTDCELVLRSLTSFEKSK